MGILTKRLGAGGWVEKRKKSRKNRKSIKKYRRVKRTSKKEIIGIKTKYKNAYFHKNTKMKGGLPRKLDLDFGVVTHQTFGDCIKELIDASYKIYDDILTSNKPTTIVCGGQSPSYYCLAMMYFKIYNAELVNIVILPHSKGGVKSINQSEENRLYCERIKEKGIILKNHVVIIDGVHTGTGILALESAIKSCFPYINISKIAINASKGISQISVDKEIVLPCEPKFSDTYPRLVTAYRPEFFSDKAKFITEFIGLDTNPVAEMIIDIAKDYPEILVENTEWYRLNNEVTEDIQKLKDENKIRMQENETIEQRKAEGGFFEPIILNDPKRYQCPICKTISGLLYIHNPDPVYFIHTLDCPNRFKTPVKI